MLRLFIAALFWAVILFQTDASAGKAKTLSAPASKPNTLTLRVASYNILMANQRQAVLENIQSVHPDIVFLQEAPKSVVKSYARVLGMNYSFGPYYSDVSEGLAILTSGKLDPVDLLKMKGERNFALVATATLADTKILLVCVHLKSLPRPLIQGMLKTLGPHQEQAKQIVKLVKSNPAPAIVGGDCNTLAVTPAYMTFSAAFKDTAAAVGTSTQPSIFVSGMGYRIDHLFVKGPWKILAARVSPKPGSDHRLIWTNLKLSLNHSER